MPRVKVNVSGTLFEFDRKILETREYHTLTKMCENAEKEDLSLEFFVDRPSDSFMAVLSFYQTGDLHMPASVCPKAFRKELQYWGVSETYLDKCCLYRFYTFFDDFDTHDRFRQENYHQGVQDDLLMSGYMDNTINRLRRKIWKVIDYKESTIPAKIYLVLVFLMVMLCIVGLGLSTDPYFQRKLTRCELMEYLENTNDQLAEKAKKKFGDLDCSSGIEFGDYDDLDSNELYWTEEGESYIDGNLTTAKSNVTLPDKRMKLFAFEVIEMITAAFFTVDLLLRLFTCPSFIRFFTSVINIFDILALVGFYIHIVVINTEKEHKYDISWIRFINYLQIFRVMRIFRIVRNVRASRVLTFSLRQNGRDMTLLVLLVMIVLSTAASLIYFIEDRDVIESIPVAWYWAMITLTTVGYGDVSPKSGFGRVVAALLAICGVLLLAITLPMFVNNFLTLYQYSCVDETIQEHTKNRLKLKGAFIVSGIACKQKDDNANEGTETRIKEGDDDLSRTIPIYVLPNETVPVNKDTK